MKKIRRLIAFLLVCTMSASLCACSQQTPPTQSKEPAAPSSETGDAGADGGSKAGQAMDISGKEFTLWAPIYWTGKVAGYEENVAWQKLQETLGVKLHYQHPPAGQEIEQFNLMIASDELPDLICTGWSGLDMYIGGGDKYVNDRVLIRLNELIDSYAPDYKRSIDEIVEPDQRKDFYTDEGNMFAFYAISPYEEWCYNGLMYRQDWMDELGLKNPKSFAEVENVLTQFKEKKGAKNPLSFPKTGIDGFSGIFMTNWDIGLGFYQKDGKIQYGPTQPAFKNYLELMNDWYKKGLIDKDFATRDDETVKRLMTSGESGAVIHSPDTISSWMTDITPMMGGEYPTESGDKRVEYRLRNNQLRPQFCYSITSACKDPEAAVVMLNYGYTEPGYMLANYGQEGETYNRTGEMLKFGDFEYPAIKYTDQMLNNPDWPVLDAIAKFKMHIGPFLRFEHEGNPAINTSTAGIRKFWTDAAGTSLNLPMMTLNAEEGKEYARIMNQIKTYQDTAVLEFIMGKRDLSEFDKYIADMEKLEISKAVSLEQAALDRYNSRQAQ